MNSNDKKTILKQFKSTSQDSPFETLTQFCRMVKKFNVDSLEKLIEKMQVLNSYYLTQVSPPNYELASSIKYSEKMTKELLNNEVSMDDVLLNLSKQLKKRVQ